MSLTDFITFFLSLFLLLRGFARGFLNSLLGPFSIIAASIISIVYYQLTQEMFISLLIGLIGPLILHLTLKFFLKTIATVEKPGFLSRMAGAALTLIWGWIFIIFTLILLATLPPWGDKLKDMHADVTQSFSYSLVKPLQNLFFPTPKQNLSASPAASPNAVAQSLAQDPRFQSVFQDPEVQNEINAHDFAKLMRNPKIMELTRELMNDPATLTKVMALYNSQIQQQKK